MISAVLDTNTLLPAFTGAQKPASVPGQIYRLWRAGHFSLTISEHILDEVERNLGKPYFQRRLTPDETLAAVAALRRWATLTPLTVTVRGIATHPEDDLILAAAVSAQVDYLVTGDHQLQKLDRYQGVSIVSPRQFLDILETVTPN